MVRRALLVVVAGVLALGAHAAPPTTTPTTPVAKVVPFHVDLNVKYGTANGQDLLLDAYVPDDTNAERVSVFVIHGGAWRTGDKADVLQEAARLAARGWVVFAPNYRLTEPEAFPAEIDDVRAAVVWAREHAYDYRLDPGRMGALGVSAGGHLAAMLATLGDGPPDRGSRILVAASWSGPMELTFLIGGPLVLLSTALLACLPTACPDRWADASPVTHVDATDAPLLLVNGSAELVPVAQAEGMAFRLEAAGVDHELVIVPGDRHGHALREDVWPATVAFLDKYLTRPTELKDPNPNGTWVLIVVIVLVTIGGVIGGLSVRRRLNAQ
ncbi:MAG: hypothetical protein QOE93_2273 [Actinomycetota bacterium]|jgi:acetyl esterase/lipase|nr:hypothetical protein [Actinomycetota bacterium]